MKNKLIYIALAAALIVCTVTGCTAQTANKETGTVTDSVSEKAKRSQTVIQYLPSLKKKYQKQKKIIRNQMRKTSQSGKKKQQLQRIQLQLTQRTRKSQCKITEPQQVQRPKEHLNLLNKQLRNGRQQLKSKPPRRNPQPLANRPQRKKADLARVMWSGYSHRLMLI